MEAYQINQVKSASSNTAENLGTTLQEPSLDYFGSSLEANAEIQAEQLFSDTSLAQEAYYSESLSFDVALIPAELETGSRPIERLSFFALLLLIASFLGFSMGIILGTLLLTGKLDMYHDVLVGLVKSFK